MYHDRWVEGTGLIHTSGCGMMIDPTASFDFVVFFVVFIVVMFVVVGNHHSGTSG